MTKGQFQKLSILGLVLMGASAVISFILPDTNKKVFASGHIQLNSTFGIAIDQNTCRTGAVVGLTRCDYTETDNVRSFTTVDGPGTSDDGATTHGDGYTNTGLLDDGLGTLVTNIKH